MWNLGDTEDPDSPQYQAEQARIKREGAARAEWLALPPEERELRKQAHEALQKRIAAIDAQAPMLNRPPPAAMPLSAYEEKVRQAFAAGDWAAVSKVWPVSKFRWSPDNPLGKYRFQIVNGRPHYIPWTRDVLENFIRRYAPPNQYGYSVLVEPGRPFAECDWDAIIDGWISGQEQNAKQYPVTDWRHVFPIYPGRYICQVYRPSTWVKIRKPLAIAAGVTAAVFLGPIVVEKASALFTGGGAGATGTAAGGEAAAGAAAGKAAAGAAAKAAETATFFQKVKAGANTVLGYVNKGRTVQAIVNGELPPPPIGVTGNSFKEWAFNVAKDQIEKEAKEYAAERGIEYVQRKMTEAEEKKLREEIAVMERELARLIPPGTPMRPDENVPAAVQDVMIREKNRSTELNDALGIAIPAALGYFVLTG